MEAFINATLEEERSTTMRKLSLLILGVFALVFVNGTAFGAAKYVLRLGHNEPVTHPKHLGAELLAKNVSERTNGELKIEIFPSAQLGNERTLVEAIQLGTVDIIPQQTGNYGRFVPLYNGLEAGWLFRDKDHMLKVMRGPLANEMNQQILKNIGVRVLAYGFAGERHLTTTNRPVYHPKDLKGLLIRVPNLDSSMATWRALEASMVPIAFSEVYMALKMGVAEGQENPVASIYSMKFHEVQKYLMFTGHVIACDVWSINNQKFMGLPENLQKILLEETEKAADFSGFHHLKQQQELLDKIKEYMTFITVDKAEFDKAANDGGLREWTVKQLGEDLFRKIKETK